MAGLFGFVVRHTRPEAWMRRRLTHMHGLMTSRPGHEVATLIAGEVAIGVSGPGILPGNLLFHGVWPDPVLAVEGEVYHLDHARTRDEFSCGPWTAVRQRWIEGGARSVGALDGLFTLALVRSGAERESAPLEIVNDRFGSRRLYLLEQPEAIVFGAELRPVAAWLGSRAQIDGEYVREVVSFGSVLGDKTWIRGIELMPPATILTLGRSGVHKARYWRWDDLPPAGSSAVDEDQLEALWDRAITPRLSGDGVGQQLSGGLDSRLILGEAARTKRSWTTVTYGEAGSDEVRFAQRAAATAGVRWVHWALPEPRWLQVRVECVVHNDAIVDVVNAFQAALLDGLEGVMRREVNGFLGDFILSSTYDIASADEAFDVLPYWESPIALPEADARRRVAESLGTCSAKGWMLDTKCRRAINAWPQVAVNVLEVRKPFVDHALLEYAMGLPAAVRRGSGLRTRLLSRRFPALAKVPWQKTGVSPRAGTAAIWSLRAARVGYRAVQPWLQRTGVPARPWVRGAVDLGRWLEAPDVRAEIRDTLVASSAHIHAWLDRGRLAEAFDRAIVQRRQAFEPVLIAYGAERFFQHLRATRAEDAVASD